MFDVDEYSRRSLPRSSSLAEPLFPEGSENHLEVWWSMLFSEPAQLAPAYFPRSGLYGKEDDRPSTEMTRSVIADLGAADFNGFAIETDRAAGSVRATCAVALVRKIGRWMGRR